MLLNEVHLKDAKRVVIKIGSSFVFCTKTGKLDSSYLTTLAKEIKLLQDSGKEIILVVGGSFLVGANKLDLPHAKLKLTDRQSCSVIGQLELMKGIADSFKEATLDVAQILLTIEDIENRKKFLSARTVMDDIIKHKIIPVVNENDLIANAELRFGDNDRLAARVSQIVKADMLILTSRQNGLYTADPHHDKSAELIKEVYEVNVEIEKIANDSDLCSGGMSAKIAAVKIAMNSECKVAIINGGTENPIRDLISGRECTWFYNNPGASKKYQK
jgi:glutamate 5-kinase